MIRDMQFEHRRLERATTTTDRPALTGGCWPVKQPSTMTHFRRGDFRSIVVRQGRDVGIGGRDERRMSCCFREVVEAVLANFPERAVIDGEIIADRNSLGSSRSGPSCAPDAGSGGGDGAVRRRLVRGAVPGWWAVVGSGAVICLTSFR